MQKREMLPNLQTTILKLLAIALLNLDKKSIKYKVSALSKYYNVTSGFLGKYEDLLTRRSIVFTEALAEVNTLTKEGKKIPYLPKDPLVTFLSYIPKFSLYLLLIVVSVLPLK